MPLPRSFLHPLSAGLALALAFCAPAAAKTPKVLFIGTDGFRGDVYGAVATPNLDVLVADGYLAREGLTADTAISGTGFSGSGASASVGGATVATGGVSGQFFGANAAALAGVTRFDDRLYDTAFGGTKNP